MFNNAVLNKMIAQSIEKQSKIILPEARISADVLRAGITCAEQKIAKIFVIAKTDEDFADINLKNVLDKEFFTIINMNKFKNKSLLIDRLCELRRHKKLSKEDAVKLLENEIYFATMLLEIGYVQGMVVGAVNTTADSLRPPLQILKGKKTVFRVQSNFKKQNPLQRSNTKQKPMQHSNSKQTPHKTKEMFLNRNIRITGKTYLPFYANNIVSSFFIMINNKTSVGENKILVLSDCAINENPTAEQISTITFNTVNSIGKLLGLQPKVALLTYSTKGSANGVHPQKMRRATELLKSKKANFNLDGEFQLDASINAEICSKKAPNSSLKGDANVLIFPDLSSGNIAYKIMQELAGYTAIGPICQGFNKPVNDVSRGASWKDILLIIAITSLQT